MLQFTPEEIAEELDDIVKHGDKTEIAKIVGLSASYIKRQFNPNDEQLSCIFKALQIICAVDDIDTERGEMFWQAIVSFRDLSKKRNVQKSDVVAEISKLNEEYADVINNVIQGKPLYEQLKDLVELEGQATKAKQAVIDKINEEKATSNTSGARF